MPVEWKRLFVECISFVDPTKSPIFNTETVQTPNRIDSSRVEIETNQLDKNKKQKTRKKNQRNASFCSTANAEYSKTLYARTRSNNNTTPMMSQTNNSRIISLISDTANNRIDDDPEKI